MDILNRIKTLREQRGLTNYKLAVLSEMDPNIVSALFRRNNQPTIPTLEKLCKGLGISLSQFFAEGDEPVALSAEQREMLSQWDTLNAEQKTKLLEFIKTI